MDNVYEFPNNKTPRPPPLHSLYIHIALHRHDLKL